MFKLDGKLKFVNVDMDYLRHLHDACSEVFYKPNDYRNKPYLGVLLTNNDKEYAFCVKIIDDIVIKATKIYDKQMNTGKAQKFACDFAKLEQALATWNKNNN